MELWLDADPDVSSVSAVPETARAIAAAWEPGPAGRPAAG